MKFARVTLFLLLTGAAPAAAQAPYTADDLLTAAGLTPQSTVSDAARLYGNDWRKMGADGIEYLAAGSLADAWMTFRPGAFVYVDCGVAPPNLPDDVVGQLCKIAREPDWRQSLVRMKQLLGNGRPTPGLQAAFTADNPQPGPLSGPQAASGDAAARDEADDDREFVELSRTFSGRRYNVVVEVAPKITTKAGTSRPAVLITWKAL